MPTPISLSNLNAGVTGVSKKVPLETVVAAETAINKLPDLSRFPVVPLPARIASDFSGMTGVEARRIPLSSLLGKGADTILAVHVKLADGDEEMKLYDSSFKCISSGEKEDGMSTYNFGAVLGHVPAVTVVKGTG
jgi:hypothetical protein